MFKLLKVGHCFHPEAMVMRGGSWKSVLFPAIVALIKHPRFGNILFDTGYTQRFHEATNPFPERCYRWATPYALPEQENLIGQLNDQDLEAGDINWVFISHFHADHIAGLEDFPAAKFICSKKALAEFCRFRGVSAVRRGYLRALLPGDFVERVVFVEDLGGMSLSKSLWPFTAGYDLFGDGSCIGIELPGHASGHLGMLFYEEGMARFLLGDACWTSEAYTSGRKPNCLAGLIMPDFGLYLETIDRLAQLYGNNQDIQLIPSHCHKTYEGLSCG